MDEALKTLLDEFEENAVLVELTKEQFKHDAKKLSDKLNKEKSEHEQMMDTFKKYDTIESKIIKFNVGGKLISTTRLTLIKKIKDKETDNFHQPNIFEGILNGYIKAKYDENRAIFIDRNPKYFGYILDYLRMAGTENEFELPPGVDKECLKKEAKFLNLRGLLNLIKYASIDSQILSTRLIDFFKICQFPDDIEFKLLYRATQDGFAARSFHLKCDKIYKTITVVKSRNGNIFGGYTDLSWDQSTRYKTDNNAYIFSLVNLHNSPIKITCSPGQNAIYCAPNSGPTFGAGHDFHIASESNSNQSSYSNFSNSYKHDKFPNESANAQSFLAGAYNFYVDEIEVFECL